MCRNAKYTSFPEGVDFAEYLGERGVGRAVLDDRMVGTEDDTDDELRAMLKEREVLERVTHGNGLGPTGTNASMQDVEEVEAVVSLDAADITLPDDPMAIEFQASGPIPTSTPAGRGRAKANAAHARIADDGSQHPHPSGVSAQAISSRKKDRPQTSSKAKPKMPVRSRAGRRGREHISKERAPTPESEDSEPEVLHTRPPKLNYDGRPAGKENAIDLDTEDDDAAPQVSRPAASSATLKPRSSRTRLTSKEPYIPPSSSGPPRSALPSPSRVPTANKTPRRMSHVELPSSSHISPQRLEPTSSTHIVAAEASASPRRGRTSTKDLRGKERAQKPQTPSRSRPPASRRARRDSSVSGGALEDISPIRANSKRNAAITATEKTGKMMLDKIRFEREKKGRLGKGDWEDNAGQANAKSKKRASIDNDGIDLTSDGEGKPKKKRRVATENKHTAKAKSSRPEETDSENDSSLAVKTSERPAVLQNQGAGEPQSAEKSNKTQAVGKYVFL
jgi:mediator of DNA damage checkpoint protein 1